MCQSKSDKSTEINNNSTQESTTNQQQQLPCPTTTEHIIHTFDINLIPCGPIIPREHVFNRSNTSLFYNYRSLHRFDYIVIEWI